MAGKVRSIRASEAFWEIMEIRAKAAGYESVNAFMIGLGRFEAMIQKPHPMTAPLAKKSTLEQAKLDADLLKIVKRGKPLKGSLFEHIVQRMKEGEEVDKAIAQEAEHPSDEMQLDIL
jgi:hypothetical protein